MRMRSSDCDLEAPLPRPGPQKCEQAEDLAISRLLDFIY